MSKQVKSHIFRGKRWNIKVRRKPAKTSHATIDPPQTKSKTIYIDPNMTGLVRLRSLLHEAWHGCDWDMAEEAVEQSAEDVARFLWRLGYRSIHELKSHIS